MRQKESLRADYGGGNEQAATRSLFMGLRSSASCRFARYSDRQSGMALVMESDRELFAGPCEDHGRLAATV